MKYSTSFLAPRIVMAISLFFKALFSLTWHLKYSIEVSTRW